MDSGNLAYFDPIMAKTVIFRLFFSKETKMKKSAAVFLIIISLSFLVAEAHAVQVGRGSPQFRAIGGVSMGAYGAMNIGLGRPDFF
jgi:hypothetical protein